MYYFQRSFLESNLGCVSQKQTLGICEEIFAGRLTFLPPNQKYQSTEGKIFLNGSSKCKHSSDSSIQWQDDLILKQYAYSADEK